MSAFAFDFALLRTPAPSVVRGLRSGAEAPSYDGVLAEFQAYAVALAAAGLAVETLDPLDDYPDAVFVEDPAFVLPEGAIVLKPGTATRIGEADAIAPALHRRFERVLALDEGFADGGDILVLPTEILIGLSGRTDKLGAKRFCELARDLGRRARIVETPAGVLHLKTACALVDEETVIATPALAGMFEGLDVIETPAGEERAANLLRLNDTILVGADYPGTIDLLAGRAPNLVPLNVGEIRKIDAGLSCLSLRWSEA
ncbi:MAG TPA: arginine deiminase family protein [Allosphingosinicella sp.]|nr:arginine deiminase family protein [Allosphingosinicella sp.]